MQNLPRISKFVWHLIKQWCFIFSLRTYFSILLRISFKIIVLMAGWFDLSFGFIITDVFTDLSASFIFTISFNWLDFLFLRNTFENRSIDNKLWRTTEFSISGAFFYAIVNKLQDNNLTVKLSLLFRCIIPDIFIDHLICVSSWFCLFWIWMTTRKKYIWYCLKKGRFFSPF